jgi:hypothetical protein
MLYTLTMTSLMSAVKKVKAEKHHIEEIYTPFPVHGLDKAMGLGTNAYSYYILFVRMCGIYAVAILMMNYIMIEDWPQDIGGKPSFSYIENMPAFVPIMFELTVFFAAHLMVITFLLDEVECGRLKKLRTQIPRTTDDHFLMEVAVTH